MLLTRGKRGKPVVSLIQRAEEVLKAETYLLATRQSAYRGHDSYLGSFTEREKLCTDARRFTKRLPLEDSLERPRERNKWMPHEAENQSSVEWPSDS